MVSTVGVGIGGYEVGLGGDIRLMLGPVWGHAPYQRKLMRL